MKKIIILWAGEQWHIIKNILSYYKNRIFMWFLDDNKKWKDILWNTSSVARFIDWYYFFVAFWNNLIRKKHFNSLIKKWAKFVSIIHPSSFIEQEVIIWNNVSIWAMAYININTTIWNNTIINDWTIIEHDNNIWENCHVAPWVVTAWWINIWNNVSVWMWSLIMEDLEIVNDSIIWAWSNVIKNISKPWIYIWNPAKFYK